MVSLLKRDPVLDCQVIQCGLSIQECCCSYLKVVQVCPVIGTDHSGVA